jgi:hypothetical protein
MVTLAISAILNFASHNQLVYSKAARSFHQSPYEVFKAILLWKITQVQFDQA